MWLYDGIYDHTGWWLKIPLKNMSSSIGMMTFPIYGKIKIHVPNHQPGVHLSFDSWKFNFGQLSTFDEFDHKTYPNHPLKHSSKLLRPGTHLKTKMGWNPKKLIRKTNERLPKPRFYSVFPFAISFANLSRCGVFLSRHPTCLKYTFASFRGKP